jgi:hypothetical protein
MSIRLVDIDFEIHSLLREGDEVVIGENRRIFHRHLLAARLGLKPDDEGKIAAALRDNPRRFDLAKIVQIGDEVDVMEDSSQFEYPKPNDLPELRQRTVQILQEKYPSLKVVSSTLQK